MAERAAACLKSKQLLGGSRPMTLDEWWQIEQPLAAVGLTAARVLEYKEGKRCSFWFVNAEKLRSFTGMTPPMLQELRRSHPDWLEQRTIDFADGAAGKYVRDTLVVSHCWEDPAQPDGQGVQFATLKQHLIANTSIKWVWYGACAAGASRGCPLPDPIYVSVSRCHLTLRSFAACLRLLVDAAGPRQD